MKIGAIIVGAQLVGGVVAQPAALRWIQYSESLEGLALERDGSGWFSLTRDAALHALGPNGTLLWGHSFRIRMLPIVDRYGNVFVCRTDAPSSPYEPSETTYLGYDLRGKEIARRKVLGEHEAFCVDPLGRYYYLDRDDNYRVRINTAAASYLAPSSIFPGPKRMFADSTGSIYIQNVYPTNKIYKLNPDGTRNWVRAVFPNWRLAYADLKGLLIVENQLQPVLHRWSSTGQTMWSQRGRDPIVSASGRIYATFRDVIFYSYSHNGEILWEHYLEPQFQVGGSLFAVDKWDNAYILAREFPGPRWKVVKIDSSGRLEWEHFVANPISELSLRASFSQDTGDIVVGSWSMLACYRQAPLALPDEFTTPSGRVLVASVGKNDRYAAEATFFLLEGGHPGSATMDRYGKLTYTPPPNFSGMVTLYYGAQKPGVAPTGRTPITITVNK